MLLGILYKFIDPGTGQCGVHKSSLGEIISPLDVGIKRSHLRTVKESALNSPSVTHLFQMLNCVCKLLTMEMVTKGCLPTMNLSR